MTGLVSSAGFTREVNQARCLHRDTAEAFPQLSGTCTTSCPAPGAQWAFSSNCSPQMNDHQSLHHRTALAAEQLWETSVLLQTSSPTPSPTTALIYRPSLASYDLIGWIFFFFFLNLLSVSRCLLTFDQTVHVQPGVVK